ncbi:MAG: glycosyl transferase [Rhodobiaceae bacterium]|nr:glycosyl transferase [Rhodobiaceae bacterium]
MSARVLFYVQHLLGMGHLYRARRICDALHDAGFAVTLVSGGEPVAALRNTPYRALQLPPLKASSADFTGLADADGNPVDEAYKAARRDALLAAASDIAPDIAIIEAYPFGRRQVRFELVPFVEMLSSTGRTLVCCSVRDILQAGRKPGRDRETVDILDRHFDAVLVHGDERLARLADTFPLAGDIVPPVFHTGIVAPPRPAPAAPTNEVLVTAGGGAVGAALLQAAAEAARDPRLAHLQFVLATGPNMPAPASARLAAMAGGNVAIVPFIDALASRLTGCALSISQAGYNTVADILVAGCPSVLIPFAAGGETEQTVRAEALQVAGRATLLRETALNGASLAEAALGAIAAPVGKIDLSLDGASATARILADLRG